MLKKENGETKKRRKLNESKSDTNVFSKMSRGEISFLFEYTKKNIQFYCFRKGKALKL